MEKILVGWKENKMMKNVSKEHESGMYLIGQRTGWRTREKKHMKNNEKCELEIRIGDNYVKCNGNCILEIRMGDNYSFILRYFDELCFPIILR